MAVTLPSINITFSQLAKSFVARSARGIALLIVRDATAGGNGYATYTDASQLAAAPYTADNIAAIKDALSFGPLRVGVAKIGATGTLADGLALIVQAEKTGWITVVDGTAEDWTALTTWTKSQEAAEKSWKAVVYNAAAPDCMHIVNFATETVTFVDARGAKGGAAYTPSLVGIFAACNVTRGATNYICSNLSHAVMPADPAATVAAGKCILVNDDDVVRIGVDVNSLTTLNNATRTADMQYIETVEAMDLIRDDITDAYKRDYVGKHKNSLSNQMLLIAAIMTYFDSLADDDILDPSHDNTVGIDVSAQRNAWAAINPDAVAWDDNTVKLTPYKRTVYLAGSLKILGSMADLSFGITLM